MNNFKTIATFVIFYIVLLIYIVSGVLYFNNVKYDKHNYKEITDKRIINEKRKLDYRMYN